MPKELIGMASQINGENPSYAYNLEGCSKGSNGRCPRGVHKCMVPGCGDDDRVGDPVVEAIDKSAGIGEPAGEPGLSNVAHDHIAQVGDLRAIGPQSEVINKIVGGNGPQPSNVRSDDSDT
eukprot:342281-Karenia_brevis.AAC.1